MGTSLGVVLTLAAVLAAPPGAGKPVAAKGPDRNGFALDLLRAVAAREPAESCATAPASVAATLGMALAGARDETAAEIRKVLRLDRDDTIADPFAALAAAEAAGAPSLGAGLADNEGYGVRVVDAPGGAAAARAGIRPGDLILAVDGRPVRSKARLEAVVERMEGESRLQVFEYESGKVVDRTIAPDRASAKPGAAASRAAWVQAGGSIDPAYVAALRTRFGAEVAPLDFRGKPAEARRAVGEWFAKAAGGSGLPVDDLADAPPNAQLLLADVLRFHGRWASPFPAAAAGAFTRSDESVVKRPLMRQTARLNWARTPGFDALELPYARVGASLLVLLPTEGRTLDRLLAELKPADLAAALGALAPRSVDVVLPRFRVLQSHRLEGLLPALGMPRAFTDRAQFGGIDPSRPLKLSTVRHAVAVDVDERGTRADAATAAAAVLVKGDEPALLAFHADRPFLFAVIDREGAVLVAGCVR